MLKMELPQESLEEAIRDYLAKLGLNLPVTDIAFTAQRSNNNKILTELTLGGVTEAVVDTVVEASANMKPAPASSASEAKEDNVAPIAAAESEPEAEAAEEEAPAEEQASSDDVPAGKSLFG